MPSDLLLQVAGFLCAAGAVYGGIRNDLKHMHERMERHEKAIDRVHTRLDGCIACDRRGAGHE